MLRSTVSFSSSHIRVPSWLSIIFHVAFFLAHFHSSTFTVCACWVSVTDTFSTPTSSSSCSSRPKSFWRLLWPYYFQVESEFSVLMPNRLPKIVVLKHCRSDAQGVQNSFYANFLIIPTRLNTSVARVDLSIYKAPSEWLSDEVQVPCLNGLRND